MFVLCPDLDPNCLKLNHVPNYLVCLIWLYEMPDLCYFSLFHDGWIYPNFTKQTLRISILTFIHKQSGDSVESDQMVSDRLYC